MQAVLHYPRSALIAEIETISTPGVTDQVVNGTESVKRATELTAEKRMNAPSSSGG
jgi:hypothetical protein